MNVWYWVQSAQDELERTGNQRLVDLMEEMPTRACDADHSYVDNVYPEALALARAQPNPWVEVFVRHWYLQSQVLHRHRGQPCLQDAVALLEFSSREDTRDCPQSICAVQDLANCYDAVDGPGYAEERIAVAMETLERIDPSWSCWKCISAELHSALGDAGRLDEERAARQQLRKDLIAADRLHDPAALNLGEADMELRAGNFAAAERLARTASNDNSGDSFELERFPTHAHALAGLGRVDEAIETLLANDDYWDEPSVFMDWVRAAMEIFKQRAAFNTIELRARLWSMIGILEENGCVRDSIVGYGHIADLCVAAGEWLLADQALQRIEALIPQLAKDLGAAEDLQQRRAELARCVSSHVRASDSVDRDALMSGDMGVERIQPLHDYWLEHPDDGAFAAWYTRELQHLGFAEMCRTLCRKMLEVDPNNGRLWQTLGFALLDSSAFDEFDEMLTERDLLQLPEGTRNHIDWVVASRFEASDPERALDRVMNLLDRDPNGLPPLEFAARLARRIGSYDLAVQLISRALEVDDQPGLHWDRIVAATLADNWQVVRESAGALELDVGEGEGPIELEWEIIRVRVTDERGIEDDWYAQRTGPATARIDSLARPEQQQLFNRTVVFDPAPLNRLDQTDDDGNACDANGSYHLLFPALELSAEPEVRVYAVDGVHPGESTWAALRERLEEHCLAVRKRSTDEYVVLDRETETEHPGLYIFLAVEVRQDLASVERTLREVLAGAEHPMIWPTLLETLGDVAGLEEHSRLEARYEM